MTYSSFGEKPHDEHAQKVELIKALVDLADAEERYSAVLRQIGRSEEADDLLRKAEQHYQQAKQETNALTDQVKQTLREKYHL